MLTLLAVAGAMALVLVVWLASRGRTGRASGDGGSNATTDGGSGGDCADGAGDGGGCDGGGGD
ncbi:hypothetical protein [Lysobacter solisilvae (ex Woo and Kim 2020)]|uniref:Uncharacterized protein n=1 Tax=Agrilutibacter terrestris TaxID=2865112 RepID=A0A7H0G1T5_9GAMM|nr:hypothetical protein [Lysobacter terrestris]QNP42251.1 hypothetical protein H8B22_11185 [Lysobacter terrestris]